MQDLNDTSNSFQLYGSFSCTSSRKSSLARALAQFCYAVLGSLFSFNTIQQIICKQRRSKPDCACAVWSGSSLFENKNIRFSTTRLNINDFNSLNPGCVAVRKENTHIKLFEFLTHSFI